MSVKRVWNEENAIRSALRRVFSRSPLVIEVLNERRRTKPRFKKDGSRHKVDAVEFHCQVCNGWYGRKLMEVDHIVPVIDPNIGYIDLNTYRKRLFCSKSNLQRICDTCHRKKSDIENAQRRLVKDTASLIELEKKVKICAPSDVQVLKKELSKYTTKKKPEEIKKKAFMLKEILLKRVKN